MWTPARFGELQILVGTILFGTCSVLMKYCLEMFGFNPFVLNGMRSFFSVTVLSLASSKLKDVFRDESSSNQDPFDILSYCGCLKAFVSPTFHHIVEKYIWIWLNGFTGWCGTSFFIMSIMTVGASKAAFLLSLYIIFVPLIEIVLYYPATNRVTAKTMLGVALAFIGTYLLCGCGLHCANSTTGTIQWGDVYGILGALGWASNIIVQNMAIKRNFCVVDLSLTSVLISCVLSLSVGVSVDLSFFKPYGFPINMTSEAWILVVTIGVFEGIGYLLQALGFRYADPTKASVLSGLESVTTMVVSHVFLGEKMVFLEYVGCIVLIIGSLVVISPQQQSVVESDADSSDIDKLTHKHSVLPTEDPDADYQPGGDIELQ